TFILELGWSSASSFPKTLPLQKKQRLDLQSDGRIRLPSLWREDWPSAVEPWWQAGSSVNADTGEEFYTNEETERRVARVPELVKDAINRLQKYGIPFFEKIAAARQAENG